MNAASAPKSQLAARFRQFAEVECRGVSPLYDRLSLGIAEDPVLLEIADRAKQREAIPHLFLGAVHYLLAKEPEHPLRSYYPSLTGGPVIDGDPFPEFRRFCLDRVPELVNVLASRLNQTNEVRRAACLLPAFCLVAERGLVSPLAVIELGASAGLLLLWDRYRYDYGDGREYGAPGSPVQLRCELRGPLPPIPAALPKVGLRIGVDLNPLDVCDPEAVAWLKALVWPDETDRLDLLQSAVGLVRAEPPQLLGGDAFALLPTVLSELSPDFTACVVRAHTPGLSQERLQSLLTEHSLSRELFLIRLGGAGQTEMRLSRFHEGRQNEELLAACDAHGEWLQWYV